MKAAMILAIIMVILMQNCAIARTIYVDCIELMTADADAVLRGSLVRIGRMPDGHYHGFGITIRVTETLKGPRADEVTVAVGTVDPKFDAWMKDNTELLFCLRLMSGEAPPCLFVLRTGQSVIELDGKGRGVLTMDFKRLATRAEILKMAREGVAAAPEGGVRKRLRFTPPDGTGFGPHLNGNFGITQVVMPVDRRLEERGKRWARSESVEFRSLAPLALSSFRSDKTIAILKELMYDPLHKDVTDNQGKGTRYYPARWPAYRVLKTWGVAVEKPVTEESLPLRRPQLAVGEEAIFAARVRIKSEGEPSYQAHSVYDGCDPKKWRQGARSLLGYPNSREVSPGGSQRWRFDPRSNPKARRATASSRARPNSPTALKWHPRPSWPSRPGAS